MQTQPTTVSYFKTVCILCDNHPGIIKSCINVLFIFQLLLSGRHEASFVLGCLQFTDIITIITERRPATLSTLVVFKLAKY